MYKPPVALRANGDYSLGRVAAAGQLRIAPASESALPHLVQKDGRHALIVDGAPFLILGAQCHNSSAWPLTLPKVWHGHRNPPGQHA